jgi:hypothetical protein
MSRYIDTRGHSTLAIGICGRCSRKFPLDELHPDPNTPGLHVCDDDLDRFDPWRLPPREAERISVTDARPDVSLAVGTQYVPVKPFQAAMSVTYSLPVGIGEGTGTQYANQGIAVATAASAVQPTVWQASSAYAVGAQVTPTVAVGLGAAGTIIYVFLCVVPGLTGVSAPAWTTHTGTQVEDGQVVWLNEGLYLP